VFNRPPCFVRGGAIDTLLQPSYILFHIVPIDISPCGVEVVFSPFDESFHRLTSPKMRTLLDFSTVRTQWKSAPFRVGYFRLCGPIHPITGWRSLFPSSHTLCSISFPCGRATTHVGSVGLTQLSVKESMARIGWSLYPGERSRCRHLRLRWDDLALWPCRLH